MILATGPIKKSLNISNIDTAKKPATEQQYFQYDLSTQEFHSLDSEAFADGERTGVLDGSHLVTSEYVVAAASPGAGHQQDSGIVVELAGDGGHQFHSVIEEVDSVFGSNFAVHSVTASEGQQQRKFTNNTVKRHKSSVMNFKPITLYHRQPSASGDLGTIDTVLEPGMQLETAVDDPLQNVIEIQMDEDETLDERPEFGDEIEIECDERSLENIVTDDGLPKYGPDQALFEISEADFTSQQPQQGNIKKTLQTVVWIKDGRKKRKV